MKSITSPKVSLSLSLSLSRVWSSFICEMRMNSNPSPCNVIEFADIRSILSDEDAYNAAVSEAYPLYNKSHMICLELPNRTGDVIPSISLFISFPSMFPAIKSWLFYVIIDPSEIKSIVVRVHSCCFYTALFQSTCERQILLLQIVRLNKLDAINWLCCMNQSATSL